ncbi:response regulator transcription factor [Phocaeicola paurosaccharolyticus]|uniref:response regulator transcription factor n=1 Tax=Phocaeicola paurosaccharolyticus TaxID=732242 RepID=UPI00054E58B7|nr:LuxR C-terminal-related transcriptional regulator [Phocaeicola paurosaccharolyticus]
MHNISPEMAIIDRNTLSCIGLQTILEEIIPSATIRVFSTFDKFICDTPDMYAHYFVSSQIYFEHTSFFLERFPKAIVLANGENLPQLKGVPTMNINQNEKQLIKSLLSLQKYGHSNETIPNQNHPVHEKDSLDLSPREIEVLVLITKGLINKEIADKLNISLTTVISHRKNITEKLGLKSVSSLTVYAIMNGYIEADSI